MHDTGDDRMPRSRSVRKHRIPVRAEVVSYRDPNRKAVEMGYCDLRVFVDGTMFEACPRSMRKQDAVKKMRKVARALRTRLKMVVNII
jgi:hypothetical protein